MSEIERLRAALSHFTQAVEIKQRKICNGDGGEGERLYGLSVGHVLTEADVRDISNQSQDFNDEIGRLADIFYEARMATLHEIGGEVLVKAVSDGDNALTSAIIANAIKRYEHLRDNAAAEAERIAVRNEGRFS